MIVSGETAYLAAEGTGAGCFDGDFAVRLSAAGGDSLAWQNDCLGATQALVIIKGCCSRARTHTTAPTRRAASRR